MIERCEEFRKGLDVTGVWAKDFFVRLEAFFLNQLIVTNRVLSLALGAQASRQSQHHFRRLTIKKVIGADAEPDAL